MHIRLHREHLEDLAAVRRVGPKRLKEMTHALAEANPLPLGPEGVIDIGRRALPDESSDTIERIVRTLVSLYGTLRRDGDATVQALLSSLASAVRAELPDDELRDWEELEPVLQGLLELPAIRLAACGLELSFEHANVLHSARVLTDIRPIFDEHATSIEAAVISHSLRLSFDRGGSIDHMVLTLDTNDLRALAHQCDRAINKGRIAEAMMRDRAGLPCMTPGEHNDNG